MRLLESRKGRSTFAFEHSEEYQQTQHKFLAAVESLEPNNIVVRGRPGGSRRRGAREVPEVGPRPSWASSHQRPPASQVLLQTSPYHVDSLLQLSDACRFQEDQEMARDLVGKAWRAAPPQLLGTWWLCQDVL